MNEKNKIEIKSLLFMGDVFFTVGAWQKILSYALGGGIAIILLCLGLEYFLIFDFSNMKEIKDILIKLKIYPITSVIFILSGILNTVILKLYASFYENFAVIFKSIPSLIEKKEKKYL